MKTAITETAPIEMIRLSAVFPSPENNTLYRPVDPNDPDVRALAESIRMHGVREPLVITDDSYILSGHRRHVAALLAGLREVPCRREPFPSDNDPDRFMVLLAEYNRQRTKSLAERMREELLTANPDEAYLSLIEHRKQKSGMPDFADTINVGAVKNRKRISAAKQQMLDAVLQVLADQRKFWPLSTRRIHYSLAELLRPLRHLSKPHSVYRNDDPSYNDLTDLVARGRICGLIPWEAIGDETRPVVTWEAHRTAGDFMREQLSRFMKAYWRDLQQSQPNWIEIVGEKMTLDSIIRPVAMEYVIPFTLGRGFCSVSPRHELLQRFVKSGREKLVILILSDHDPAGMTIADSFARSMRDDFGLAEDQVLARKIAITPAQIAEHRLPHGQKATDKKASTRAEFIRRYGVHAYELEALSPETLQGILRDSIDQVLDVDAFNAELDAEKRDAMFLQSARAAAMESLRDIATDFDGGQL